MSSFVGVHVSDSLHSQFTQVQLRGLKSNFISMRKDRDHAMVGDLPSGMAKLKAFRELLSEEEIREILGESYSNISEEIDFETFLRVYLNLQSRASEKLGGSKHSSAFLKATTTTLLHTIDESEKASYVAHINSYLGDDPFLKKYLPLDPVTNDLFELAKDGVLLCKLINVAVPGTIDERAINTKRFLNPWERNENHTLCLNSAKAIGCTVVNIGTQDLIEGRVIFVPNYNVSVAEMLIPGSELSQHISTAGMEASGTSNMKFALNGCIIIGTLDGANVEIREEIGEENFFLFGAQADEVPKLRKEREEGLFKPDPHFEEAKQFIRSGAFGSYDYNPLLDSLEGNAGYGRGDYFLVGYDFPSYMDAQARVDEAYKDRKKWLKMSILSTAGSGKFSSDRTISQYAKEIWNIKACPVP